MKASPHRLRRVLLAVTAALAVVVGGVAASGLWYADSYFGSIHRISGITALTSADQPVMPATTRESMTILMMSINVLPPPPQRHGNGPLGSSKYPMRQSGLIALLHINANHKAASMTTIPPNAVVNIPGHGRQQLWNALTIGGPSLLITTVDKLTNVRITHFAVVDFNGVQAVIAAVGGVDVVVKTPFSSGGYYFHAGLNHLGPAKAMAYARWTRPSQIGRGWLQQSLIRGFAYKAAGLSPSQTLRVARAVARVLSLDSNFSNAELIRLTFDLRNMKGSQTLWVNAPTTDGSPVKGGTNPVHLNSKLCAKLWDAIRHDAVASFAQRYPWTLTPIAPF